MKNKLVVTIDGPAGAGKTHTSKMVAKELGLTHYTSGNSYRAITFALIKNNLIDKDLESEEIKSFIYNLDVINNTKEIFLDKKDITNELRTKEIDLKVPYVAAIKHVREKAKQILLLFVDSGVNLLVEGRDMGSVVLTAADVKIFLTASIDSRTKRRLAEVENLSYEEVYKSIESRDLIDASRRYGPLKVPENGFLVDNSDLTLGQTVNLIVGIIRGKCLIYV